MLFVCNYLLLGRYGGAQEVHKSIFYLRNALAAPVHFCSYTDLREKCLYFFFFFGVHILISSQVSLHKSVPAYSAIPTKLVFFALAPNDVGSQGAAARHDLVRWGSGSVGGRRKAEAKVFSPCGRVVLRRRENAPLKGILLSIVALVSNSRARPPRVWEKEVRDPLLAAYIYICTMGLMGCVSVHRSLDVIVGCTSDWLLELILLI